MDIGNSGDNNMNINSSHRRIGIYRELAIVIVISITIAVLTSIGTFIVCSHYGILVDVIEDTSDHKKRYDIQVMNMVRELDSAINTAMDEITANNNGEEKTISDAMKYLLRNDRMPFESEEVNNMTITITNRNGLILWKTPGEEGTTDYKNNKVYVDIEALIANSYDDESLRYSFVYTKSVSKILYYIIFETDVMPEYVFADMKLKAVCIALGCFIFLLSVLILTKRRIDYIRYLSEIVDEISRGNLNTFVDKKGYDELTVIAESIDEMQHNLDRMIKEERENDRNNMELITNLSHDIKTPMTIITGYLDVVISGKYSNDEERDDYIKRAFFQVEKINVMIHKIFMLARNEKIQPSEEHPEKCNISLMLKQDIYEFDGIAQKENRSFNVDIPNKPLYVEIGIERIREVFDNILMNAIKYSKINSVINVAMTEEKSSLLITVSNETDNIRESDCEKIFDKFYRVDHARSSSVSGNGLGLAIVKETVEGYGGKVWAEYVDGIFSIKIRFTKIEI